MIPDSEEDLSREGRTLGDLGALNSTSDFFENLSRILQGIASLKRTIVETKKEAVVPLLDIALNTKKSLLESPVVKSVVEAKSSVVSTLPKAIMPFVESVPKLFRMSLCNLACPLIGTEQCKKDHCDEEEQQGEEEEVTVLPRDLDSEATPDI